MTSAAQRQQIDQNYDAFQRVLGAILSTHRDQYALMRDRKIIDYYPSAGEAYRAGLARYSDILFSIQEVTDQAIDLGFFSHVSGV